MPTQRNQYLLIATVIFSLTLVVCKNKASERGEEMTVIRDCTGTYLRVNGKDFQVCNLEKASSFADGETATITYKKIEVCTGSANNAPVCHMLHVNEGWVEIEAAIK